MKQKAALIISCLLLLSAAAGCNSSQKTEESSAASAAVSEVSSNEDKTESRSSSAAENSGNASETTSDSGESSTSNRTSQTSQSSASDSSTVVQTSQKGVTIDEDGNITIDPDAFEDGDDVIEIVEPDSSEDESTAEADGNSTYMDLSYQIGYIPPTNITSDIKLPAVYSITSEEELKDFISKNNTVYSLNEPYSEDPNMDKLSFRNRADDLEPNYFTQNDMMIVITPYAKSSECDLGNVVVKDNTIDVEIWAQQPKNADDTGYVCLLVNMEKGVMNGKTLHPFINSDYISEEEE